MNLTEDNYITINRKTYDLLAQEFDQKINVRKIQQKRIIAKFKKFIKKNKTQNNNILELGPAAGYTTNLLTNEGFLVDAIEFSNNLFKICKRNAPLANVINREFLGYNFKSKKYDGILAIAFIHLFPKKITGQVLSKIYSLLNKSGIAYLSTTLHSVSKQGFETKSNFNKANTRFRRKFNFHEIKSELVKAGFKIVDKEIISDLEVVNKRWIDFIVKK